MRIDRKVSLAALGLALLAFIAAPAIAADYAAPKPLTEGAQAPTTGFKGSKGARIAYMPPATEFNYYIAIGEGIKAPRPSAASRPSCSRRRAARTSTARWA